MGNCTSMMLKDKTITTALISSKFSKQFTNNKNIGKCTAFCIGRYNKGYKKNVSGIAATNIKITPGCSCEKEIILSVKWSGEQVTKQYAVDKIYPFKRTITLIYENTIYTMDFGPKTINNIVASYDQFSETGWD